MSKYINADRLEKDEWSMVRIRQASPTEMVYETKKPTDFPAADVEEVRHGRWEERGNLPVGCSECGCKSNKKTAYCPHCGAKMYIKINNKQEDEKQAVHMIVPFFQGWAWNNSNITRHTECVETAMSENREVARGKWIFNPRDGIEAMFIKPKCSVCGFESADGLNYCPNCGARMDGE